MLYGMLIALALAGGYAYYLFFDPFPPNDNMVLGVSFSPEYAQFLGLDYKDSFQKILNELQFKYIRLSAQWNTVEPARGQFNFEALDWLMREAAKHPTKVIIAIGQKTPRWPECHLPEWAKSLSDAERLAAVYAYDTAVVARYKNNPALEMWQVENEPFLGFGVCPMFTQKNLADEMALVKKLDPHHPTLVSDSGELSAWRRTARAADYFGTTLYRVVWNRFTGYWSYDWLPAAFYRAKLKLNGRSAATTFVTELQAEPWIPNGTVMATSLEEQFKSMPMERFKKNVDFAKRLGVSRSYFWGVEWWQWLAQKGHSEMWEYARGLKKQS